MLKETFFAKLDSEQSPLAALFQAQIEPAKLTDDQRRALAEFCKKSDRNRNSIADVLRSKIGLELDE